MHTYKPLTDGERERLRQTWVEAERQGWKRRRGLYEKFLVCRADGRDRPGEKHAECRYFVLDLDHDPHAIAAISAYADSCSADGFQNLADDLNKIVFEAGR